MHSAEKVTITVEATIQASISKVWELWTSPEHIMQWNNADPSWHTPNAQNDLREEGRFVYRMEAKDGSFGFDFGGTYVSVEQEASIEYTMDDGREALVEFKETEEGTVVTETFEAEKENSIEMQHAGWQAILNNFKAYAESAMQGSN
jgi:uncharacterized protein YndB with AHSA1/START domain